MIYLIINNSKNITCIYYVNILCVYIYMLCNIHILCIYTYITYISLGDCRAVYVQDISNIIEFLLETRSQIIEK